MTGLFTIRWPLVAALAIAGCGGGSNGGSTTAVGQDQDRGSETPIGSNEQLEDVRLLAMDLAAENLCSRVRGRFMPVGGDDEPSEGRMWVRGCEARVEDEQLVLDVNAVMWTWVDRSSSAVGAEFTVSQYVGLDADLEIRVIPHIRYRRDGSPQAFMWLEPVREPDVEVRVLGGVDAEAEGLWSEFVAFAAGVIGPSENERAAQQVREQGGQRLAGRIDDGMTVAVDLCTGEYAAEMGRVSEMPTSESSDEGLPGDSTRVRVQGRGLDVAGPLMSNEVTVRVTDGAPIRARLVCQHDAYRMVESFLEGGLDAVPEVDVVAEERVVEGNTVTISAQEQPACDLVLVSNVAAIGQGTSTFEYLEETTPVALVAGCGEQDQQGQTADRGSEAAEESDSEEASEQQASAAR